MLMYLHAMTDYRGMIDRSKLSLTIKRNIKRKEKELGRTCRSIWADTNRHGQTYMYATFCKNWNRMVVTIGYLSPHINRFLSA